MTTEDKIRRILYNLRQCDIANRSRYVEIQRPLPHMWICDQCNSVIDDIQKGVVVGSFSGNSTDRKYSPMIVHKNKCYKTASSSPICKLDKLLGSGSIKHHRLLLSEAIEAENKGIHQSWLGEYIDLYYRMHDCRYEAMRNKRNKSKLFQSLKRKYMQQHPYLFNNK